MWYEIRIRSYEDVLEAATVAFYKVDVYELVVEDPTILQELSNDEKSWDYTCDNVLSFEHEDIVIKGAVELEGDNVDEFLADFKSSLLLCLPEHISEKDVNVEMVLIDPDEYKDEWKKYFKPFYICDKVAVCPSWEEFEVKDGEKLIDIDPSGAFGTGNHETTSMCAVFIEKYMNEADDVLDIGCGSGILSLVSMKLGANSVLSFDTDENAVEIARENAVKNGYRSNIEVIHSELNTNGKYDLVVANIIADVIMMISPDVKNNLKEDAVYIVSGIISNRRDEVVDELIKQGYKLIDESEAKEWCALCFKVDHE